MAVDVEQIKEEFRKSGVIHIQLRVAGWEAGDFDILLEDLDKHGEIEHIRFEEELPAES